jgi:hypothetical protein
MMDNEVVSDDAATLDEQVAVQQGCEVAAVNDEDAPDETSSDDSIDYSPASNTVGTKTYKRLNEAKMWNEAMSKQRIRDLEDQKTYMADLIKVLTEGIASRCSYTGQLVEEVERLERENERLEEANQRIALPPNAMEDDDRET